jgi:hypothetical protein
MGDYEESLIRRIVTEIDKRLPKIRIGRFVAAEATDANLSQVIIPGGTTIRMVPKLESATGLVANDVVVLQGSETAGYLILGVLVGDRTNTGDLGP